MKPRKVYFAVPMMNEPDWQTTLQSIVLQDYPCVEVYVIVNHPQSYFLREDKQEAVAQNLRTLSGLGYKAVEGQDFVRCVFLDFPLWVADACTKDKAMDEKHIGVGWARKILMDKISSVGQASDIIISADADTIYPPSYASSVVAAFDRCPEALGFANPYFHFLTDDENINRSILRYEIYMRSYNIHLMKINSPYGYTAMGSAMSCTLAAYRKVNGLTPHKSGEDFYFLQKLAKAGKILIHNEVKVYPSARNSDRVFFGTGPAVSKGLENNWSSYPIYPFVLFEAVFKYFQILALWYPCPEKEFLISNTDFYPDTVLGLKEIPKNLPPVSMEVLGENTPKNAPLASTSEKNIPLKEVHDFFIEKFGKEWWLDLRKNSKTKEQFLRFCNEKIDGLRLLQFFKAHYIQNDKDDFANIPLLENKWTDWPCPLENVSVLQEIRLALMGIEAEMQAANASEKELGF